MVKCAFCGREEDSFKGVHLIRNDGNVDYFCSGKCRKSTVKLHRDKRTIKWTESYRIALAKSTEKARVAKVKSDEEAGKEKSSEVKEKHGKK